MSYKFIIMDIKVVSLYSLRKIEAMVYAMADKFLDIGDLEKLKEEIKMTRLGEMLEEDVEEIRQVIAELL